MTDIDESIPENGRFSFRLNAEELERVRLAMEHVRRRYPAHVRITQKLLFLEGLDAIEYRVKENKRKSGAGTKKS